VPPGPHLLAPTHLSSFAACRHRTGLDLLVALGELKRPTWFDPHAETLRERGEAHERQYVEQLAAGGLTITDVRDVSNRVQATRDALAAGVDVVVQGELRGDDGWNGRPDILCRVDTPSALGAWSYEVYDTKLARETSGGTILQLAVYTEMLGALQGRMPERFHVVTPDPATPVHSYRWDEYAAYYRLLKRAFLATLAQGATAILEATYPEPVEHCEVCRWWDWCLGRRRADDHLSFIAGASRTARAELEANDVRSLAAAGTLPVPLPFKPSRGAVPTYVRLREQARVQLEQRERRRLVWELAQTTDTEGGLLRLPEPSPEDVFLDLEGSPYAREGGREYLFGLWSRGAYRSWWARDDSEERAAFEAVMDLIERAWAADPGMHVYHFGHYEASALRRLSGRYAVRGEAIDRLLRATRFVDLHAITRKAIRAGIESYSIKQLEPYYGFTRDADLRDVRPALLAIELVLESMSASADLPMAACQIVETYNADDCRSAEGLRNWLERIRDDAIAQGFDLPRAPETLPDAPAAVSELDAQVNALRARLLDGIPPEAMSPGHAQHTRWLLAYLIDWHRREEKAAWWDYFRAREVEGEDLLDEPSAVTGLEFVERAEIVRHRRTGKPTGSVIDRYRYPPQEVNVRRGDLTLRNGTKGAELVGHDRERRTVDLKKGPGQADAHHDTLFAGSVVHTRTLQESLMRLAEDPDARSCGHDLLHRHLPRLKDRAPGDDSPLVAPGEDVVAALTRLVLALDRSVLPVQGPPGAGKTYAGAQMIRALVREGRRVGVTAVSHKVIVNLLEEVARQAQAAGEVVHLCRKGEDEGTAASGGGSSANVGGDPQSANGTGDPPWCRVIGNNDAALASLATGEAHVLGGTAWLWARKEAAGVVDVLFVDEAGQMSLANVLAVSQAATSLVLLGDPQQLEQPQKASHPDGVDVSALHHVLGDAKTMDARRGVFMPVTWRLAPAICGFTSEVFYESRLTSRPGLDAQVLRGCGRFDGAGLWYVPVPHTGNHNTSDEEVEVVVAIVAELLRPGATWVNGSGKTQPLTANDLRIVAPYNAHVNRLRERLEARGVPVGTVDRFQGQEGPVVIYSMATSSPADAPRGMEFLYSLNRLNVASSRARCAVVVVASPAVCEPECRTPRQMRLASALCRYRELASEISLPAAGSGV
jgi:predicted RecB family nuclease